MTQEPKKIESLKYVTLEELYNFWGKNVAQLDMVLKYIEKNASDVNLVNKIKNEYGIPVKYLLVKENDFYRQKNNTDRLKTALHFVKKLLPETPQKQNQKKFLKPKK
jgi:hypothetical protein